MHTLSHFKNTLRRILYIFTAAVLLIPSLSLTAAAQSSDSDTANYHSDAAAEYCKSITPTTKNNACQDGYDNKQDCNVYQELSFDPTIATSDLVSACQKAREDQPKCAQAAAGGAKATGTHSACPKASSNTDSGNSDEDEEEGESEFGDLDFDEIISRTRAACGLLDLAGANITNEVKNICDVARGDDLESILNRDRAENNLDAVNKANEKKLPDNKEGQYVNGANQYQSIEVSKVPGDKNAAIIFINGGGWTKDDKVGQKIVPEANKRGYTTFVASYRLGPSGIYYQLDDVLRAIKHVKDNAGMYGIDPERVAIWGDSAGGSLAVRAASTGKTGLKAQVGWSAPTNAYTALFHSIESFGAGINHSTCAPTDTNVSNLLTAEDKQDLARSAYDFASNALKLGQNSETVSKQIEDAVGDGSGLGGGVRRIAAKTIINCIDNFKTASPALYASANSPPGFFAGFSNDPLIHPGQAYQMRDKLRALGIASEALILVGEKGTIKPGKNHLDYNEKFVGPSLNFVDKFLHPGQEDEAEKKTAANNGGGSGSSSSNSNGGSGNNGGGSGANTQSASANGNSCTLNDGTGGSYNNGTCTASVGSNGCPAGQARSAREGCVAQSSSAPTSCTVNGKPCSSTGNSSSGGGCDISCQLVISSCDADYGAYGWEWKGSDDCVPKR